MTISSTPAEPASPAPPAPPPPATTDRRGWSAGRVVSLVIGCVIGLVSFGLLAAAGVATWATNTQRDSSGYLTTDTQRIVTPTSAITSDAIDFAWNGPVSPSDVLGTVRIRATSLDPTVPVFIGVGPKAAVDRYLAGVPHAVVTDWAPVVTKQQLGAGRSPAVAPTQARFWTAQASGLGTQSLRWRPTSGDWRAVVMNASGTARLAVGAEAGATVPDLAWLAVGLFIGGGLLLAVALVLVVVPIVRSGRSPAVGPAP
jgi:hypothetical protein